LFPVATGKNIEDKQKKAINSCFCPHVSLVSVFMPVLTIIPARMASTRLPGKPLSLIGDKPMIAHVVDRAKAADVGPVLVATDHEDIASAVKAHGAEAVLTRSDHESGSDRIHEALSRFDPDRHYDKVINVQGDLPFLAPELVQVSLSLLTNPDVAIGTLAYPLARHEEEASNPNRVKIIGSPIAQDRMRALYFTRAAAPWQQDPLYCHIGLYAYQRQALERFVTLPPSFLEQTERLEQLRALEAGMRIDAALVADNPPGVDTPEDLARARHYYQTLQSDTLQG
jgi:3-deoxy-manno-octulosonate cytidylyltransferase (CMP-KDO synthetase)